VRHIPNSTMHIKYKYSFWQILKEYAPSAQSEIRSKLGEAWGVTPGRVAQIINTTKESEAGITAEQAVIAAKILNVQLLTLLEPCEMKLYSPAVTLAHQHEGQS